MSPAPARINWTVLVAFWAIIVAIYVVRAMYSPGLPLFADTDDAMRLVDVRDFLGGQAWYDMGGGTQSGSSEFLVQDPDGYLLRFAEPLGERPRPR